MYKITYLNCEGQEVTREYDHPIELLREIESDAIDAPMLDAEVVEVSGFNTPKGDLLVQDVYNACLVKKGDKVRVKGDFFNEDYDTYINTVGIVEEDIESVEDEVCITLEEIDRDRGVSIYIPLDIIIKEK